MGIQKSKPSSKLLIPFFDDQDFVIIFVVFLTSLMFVSMPGTWKMLVQCEVCNDVLSWVKLNSGL
jgi:hypothetical protein